MSAAARESDLAALPLAVRRSAAGRSRRADDGTLTEMARSLLRDARESRGGEGEWVRAAAGQARIACSRPGTRSRRPG